MEAPIAQFVAPNRSFFNVFFKRAFSYSTQKTQAFFNSFHPRAEKKRALFATGQKTTSTFLHRNINTPSVFLYVAPEAKTKSSTFCNWSEITHTCLHPIIKTHIFQQHLPAPGQKSQARNRNTPSVFLKHFLHLVRKSQACF